MSCHFDLVEERIQRLENFVLGGSTNQQNDDQLLDSLLSISYKLAGAVSKSEKVSVAMKRVEEITKVSDPLFTETDSLIPKQVKLQMVLSKEEELKEMENQMKSLDLLKTVLDSQPIQDVENLQSRLSKITERQAGQQNEMAQLTAETYSLLQSYKDIV